MVPFLARKKEILSKRSLLLFVLLSACFLTNAPLLTADVADLSRKLADLKNQESMVGQRLQQLKGMWAQSRSQEDQLKAEELGIRSKLQAVQNRLQRCQALLQNQTNQIYAQGNGLLGQIRGTNTVGGAEALMKPTQAFSNRAMQFASQAQNLQSQIAADQANMSALSSRVEQISAQRQAAASRSRQLEMQVQQENAALAGIRREIAETEKQLEAEKSKMTPSEKTPLSRDEMEQLLSSHPEAREAYDALCKAEKELDALMDSEKMRGLEFGEQSKEFSEAVKKLTSDLESAGFNFALGVAGETLKADEFKNKEWSKTGSPYLELLDLLVNYDEYIDMIRHPDYRLVFKGISKIPLYGMAADSVKDGVVAYYRFKEKVESTESNVERNLTYQFQSHEGIETLPNTMPERRGSQDRQEIETALETMQERRGELAGALGISADRIPKRVNPWQIENHLTLPPASNAPPLPDLDGERLLNSSVIDLKGAGPGPFSAPGGPILQGTGSGQNSAGGGSDTSKPSKKLPNY
jgi:septal ring factor EnvC (AmiA/AmiB activator)